MIPEAIIKLVNGKRIEGHLVYEIFFNRKELEQALEEQGHADEICITVKAQ